MGEIETRPYSTAKKIQTAILVAVSRHDQTIKQTIEYLDELDFLASTCGIKTVGRFTQNLDHPDKVTYVGKGKLDEIKDAVKALNCDYLIFDDDLTPGQNRNIEREIKVKILDRTLLILDIFSLRAQTAQARLQVELAQYEYLLPRLTRMWTHLERQKGGVGLRSGAGEKELETDRRRIRIRLDLLKDKLKKLEQQAYTRRKGRQNEVKVALVGYTNVGKSTIMNLLTKGENVLVENKLFATVDSTVRKVTLNRLPFLLTDTVGFIRKLPTHLIESFKSTLDEVREADILIHVVDYSNPAHPNQIEVVNDILHSIGASGKPTLLVFNKIDAWVPIIESDDDEPFADGVNNNETLTEAPDWEVLAQINSTDTVKAVFVSATEKSNVDKLKEALTDLVESRFFAIYPNYFNGTRY